MLEDIKCVAYALIAACGVYAWLYALGIDARTLKGKGNEKQNPDQQRPH